MTAENPMTLADYTCEQLCLPDVVARDAPAVLSELSHALEGARVVRASLSLFNAALNQYFLARADHLGAAAYSVGSLPSVLRTAFAVAHTRDECWWRHGSPAVNIVFLIATRPVEMASCQDVVAGIAQLIADPLILAELQSATTGAQMHVTLARVRVGEPGVTTAAEPTREHRHCLRGRLRWW